MNLKNFKDNIYSGLESLFNDLNIPVNRIDSTPIAPKDILTNTFKSEYECFELINDVMAFGMVDDAAFSNQQSESLKEIKNNNKNYEGILVFGVTLKKRKNDLLPARSQLAEITRAFNREFHYTPVVTVFKYENYISIASAERITYKQEWREGEKTGKVTILRDIHIDNPHTGHLKILSQLKITNSSPSRGGGRRAEGSRGSINSFDELYKYWQQVFNVSLLNKEFYKELSNWYFWAIKHVTFPGTHLSGADSEELKAKNVIRMLTRLLFVWFIKEKQLIPEELFDLDYLKNNIIKENFLVPDQDDSRLHSNSHIESVYYKAILQNLFFATLNCPIEPEKDDDRKRGFRKLNAYGQHRGTDYLMRYEKYFRDPEAFVQMLNKVVPFLNGGLFECLDNKDTNKYIDGFSDGMKKNNYLIVPDHLFFGQETNTDLSKEYGLKNNAIKNAAVKGLINILKSYKFTVAENTPIEEDVALDPELLGKVFENLLASYNPETKTTARKQTGSFYTPREIVNYMVDESLIAYLKNNNSSPSRGGGRRPEGSDVPLPSVAANSSSPSRGGGRRPEGLSNLPHLKTFRKDLRKNLTPAEAKLWSLLKSKQLDGKKFRRQFSVANYILDFYCHEEKLAIELDGQVHCECSQAEYDFERDLFLNHTGIKVIRFENKLVWDNPEGLLEFIKNSFGWSDKQLVRQDGTRECKVSDKCASSVANNPSVQNNPSVLRTAPLEGEQLFEELLRRLVSFDSSNPFENDEKATREIIQALSNCKILDPACGSGAFPMGVLQKMVHILKKLDPENKIWREVQEEKAKNEAKEAFDIEDKEARNIRLHEISEAFDRSINDPDYARKLFLIENCIYGIDIQSIATQISKLRFFISLVVEQQPDNKKPNFGILPLPNLETRFVTANTLIGIDKPDKCRNIFDTTEIKSLESQLKKVRSKIFSARTKETKQKHRKQDKDLREAIANKLSETGWTHDTAQKLADWDPYDQNASSPFFDPEWMFDIKDGFDIVIGNPPYLRIQGIRETNPSFADWLSKNYESATGSFDLYAVFTERSVKLTSKNGLVNFIMPVKWTNAAFGKGLRSFLLKEASLTKVISFDEYQVFNASTYTGIQLFQKNSRSLLYNQLNTNLYTQNALNNYLRSLSKNDFNTYNINSLEANGFTLTDNTTGKILALILKHEVTIANVFSKIFQGIATSKDSVYFLTNCIEEGEFIHGFSKELNKTVIIEKDIAKPLIKGDQVHKYEKLKTTNIVIFPYHLQNGKPTLMEESFIKANYPLAHQYLKNNESVLRNREKGRLLNDPYWFKYIYPKNQDLFEKVKLMAPDVSMGGNFTIDENGEYYSTTTVYGYVLNENVRESYWYYMSLMNSQVLWWYLKNTGAVMANGYFRFKPDYLKPFKIPNSNAVSELELLSKILYYTTRPLFDSFLKTSNALVFNLYFPEHMKERDIDVLEFVKLDIEEVMKSFSYVKKYRDSKPLSSASHGATQNSSPYEGELLLEQFAEQILFEKLADDDKQKVIEQLHARWTNPENEVVKRMAMFKEKSPDILKPILES